MDEKTRDKKKKNQDYMNLWIADWRLLIEGIMSILHKKTVLSPAAAGSTER